MGIIFTLAVSFIAEILITYLAAALSFLHLSVNSPDFTPPTRLAPMVLYLIFFCIVAPICEEFIFRGVILHSLRRFGNGLAILVSALLFGLIHGNLNQFPLAFCTGLALGFFVLEFKSIWATVIMHAFVNLVSTIVSYLSIYHGNAIGGVFYMGLGIMLFAISVSTFFLLRRQSAQRKHFLEKWYTPLPISFLLKKAISSLGMLVCIIVLVVVCLLSLRIV